MGAIDNAYVVLICTLWAAAAGGFAWHCAALAHQITYVTLADGRRQERKLPFLFRLLLPLAPNLVPVFSRAAFTRTREKLDRRLVAAGFEGLLNSQELLSLKVFMPATIGLFWIAFVNGTMAVGPPVLKKAAFFLYLFGPVYLFLYPSMWLRRELKLRHKSIQRSLPFVLDILTLSVEAGMDFMTALQRHVEGKVVDALSEELIRVIREIQLGKTRRQALRDLSIRVDLGDLRSVVNALVQADELGVSIGTILRIQADQIRLRRFERAEKLANEAPVKMLFPLMCFIFPAVFLILLGPVLFNVTQKGF